VLLLRVGWKGRGGKRRAVFICASGEDFKDNVTTGTLDEI